MASLRVEFFGVNRPVLVGASSIEELFDKGEIFVHGRKFHLGRLEVFLGGTSADLFDVERRFAILIELMENAPRGVLHLGKIERSIIVLIDGCDRRERRRTPVVIPTRFRARPAICGALGRRSVNSGAGRS